MVKIITDSTCDLGTSLASKAGIDIVPLYVYLDGKAFIDGVNLSLVDLFNSVATTGTLPKTSAPTVSDFIKAFSGTDDILYISISSKLSATHQNALLAREISLQESPGRSIVVIDSLNLSAGIGLLALKAARLRDLGFPLDKIEAQIINMVPRVRTSFIIDTLDYLHKGGRCSAIQNIVGNLFSIRPIIAMRPDGTLGIRAKTRGSRLKAMQVMLSHLSEDLPGLDCERIFVTHTGCEQDAEFLKSEILRIAPVYEVQITTAGSVIASHCGPDTIGILYMTQ